MNNEKLMMKESSLELFKRLSIIVKTIN